MDRVNALAAENRALATDNQSLVRRLDSLQKALRPAPTGDSLEAKLAGMKMQIQILDTRMDSSVSRIANVQDGLAGKANAVHVHFVSQVTGLQDSLNGRVVAKGGGPLKVCTGHTEPGIGWTEHNASTDGIVVKTDACGFTETPQYFTSVGGVELHWKTTGGTSIYKASPTGFTVYLSYAPWLSPAEPPPLESGKYFINWVAIGR